LKHQISTKILVYWFFLYDYDIYFFLYGGVQLAIKLDPPFFKQISAKRFKHQNSD